jgi:uncharacterized protein YlxW (UPF0749 family)
MRYLFLFFGATLLALKRFWLLILVVIVSVAFYLYEKAEYKRAKKEAEKYKNEADSLKSVIATQEKVKDLVTKDTLLTHEIDKNSDSVNAAKQFFK